MMRRIFCCLICLLVSLSLISCSSMSSHSLLSSAVVSAVQSDITDGSMSNAEIITQDPYKQIIESCNIKEIKSYDFVMKYFPVPLEYHSEIMQIIAVDSWENTEGVINPVSEYDIIFLDNNGNRRHFYFSKDGMSTIISTPIFPETSNENKYYKADVIIYDGVAGFYQKCIPVFTAAETSDIGLYKFALDVAGEQDGLKSWLSADNGDEESVLFANPDIFRELNDADRIEMIKYFEKRTGRKVVLKTREACVLEGYADYSNGSFGFIDGKYSEFSMHGQKADQNTYNFLISFLTGPLAYIGCSFSAVYIDGTWQVEDRIPIRVS